MFKSIFHQYLNTESFRIYQAALPRDLVVEYSETVEDFTKTLESHFMGFILNFNVSLASVDFDVFKFLTYDDTERLKELNIQPHEMPKRILYTQ